MWTFLYGSQSPSEIIESTSWPCPIRRPSRPFGTRYGAFDIDSMPPATTTENSDVRRALAPSMTARSPDPQTLWTVTQPAAGGSPAPRAAWRAGAWPMPAWRTLPNQTCSTRSAGTPARSRAAAMATLPSFGAERVESDPRNDPMGVRAAERIRTSFMWRLLRSGPGRRDAAGEIPLYPQAAGAACGAQPAGRAGDGADRLLPSPDARPRGRFRRAADRDRGLGRQRRDRPSGRNRSAAGATPRRPGRSPGPPGSARSGGSSSDTRSARRARKARWRGAPGTSRSAFRRSLGLPVSLHDERLTSRAAEGNLADAGVRAGRRDALRDAEAAAVLLRDFLSDRRARRPGG